MNILLRGVVRGRTVELDRDPGFEENRVGEIYEQRQRSKFRELPE